MSRKKSPQPSAVSQPPQAAAPVTTGDAGSRKPRPVSDAPASRCGKCGSTRRTPYSHTRHVDSGGIDHATGAAYNRVTFRNTTCSDCGQARVDRTRELV